MARNGEGSATHSWGSSHFRPRVPPGQLGAHPRPRLWLLDKDKNEEGLFRLNPNPRHLIPKNQTHGQGGDMVMRKTASVSDFSSGVMFYLHCLFFRFPKTCSWCQAAPGTEKTPSLLP